MKLTKLIISFILLGNLFIACKTGNDKADGYGNFEATEITVSAESNGKINQFLIEEGQFLKMNAYVGYIDSLALAYKKEQLKAAKEAVSSKLTNVSSQINVLKTQLKTANINQKRIENLVKENAGTPKQLDDINGEIAVLHQQIKSIETQNNPILNDVKNLDAQLKQLEDQIQKSKIINPIDGTVLVKYAEPHEIITFGKPLYKIADLSVMQLRVYLSEKQLNSIKIGQEVTVKIDAGETMKNYIGTISWIAAEAEFTPKIIQTKEERVNLVYALKIDVKNDGSLKIGMPAEMWLLSPTLSKGKGE